MVLGINNTSLSSRAKIAYQPPQRRVNAFEFLRSVQDEYCHRNAMPFAGRFVLISPIGYGGSAAVFKAFDLGQEETVALKIADAANSPYLAREAETAKILSAEPYPFIVQCKATGNGEEVEGQPTSFIAYEHIEGKTLAKAITDGKIPLDRVLEIASQICCGLWFAQSKGYAHGDLKPDNIMLDINGQVKILDIGSDFGTEKYFSPKKVSSPDKSIEHSDDIYALGLIIHEMIARINPFQSIDTKSEQFIDAKTRHLLPALENVPNFVQELVDRLTNPITEECFQSYSEIYAEIERTRAELSVAEEEIIDLTAFSARISAQQLMTRW